VTSSDFFTENQKNQRYSRATVISPEENQRNSHSSSTFPKYVTTSRILFINPLHIYLFMVYLRILTRQQTKQNGKPRVRFLTRLHVLSERYDRGCDGREGVDIAVTACGLAGRYRNFGETLAPSSACTLRLPYFLLHTHKLSESVKVQIQIKKKQEI
jgi:hypothetical protein